MQMRKLLLAALAAFSVSAVSVAQTSENPFKSAEPQFGKEVKDAVLKRMTDLIQNVAYVPGVDFSKWSEFVAKRQADIDKSSNADEFVRALNGGLREFGFSHIVMSTPRAAQARMDRKAVGIGVRLQPEEGGMRVVTVVPGAPAVEAGIEPGDLIIGANGKKVTETTQIAGDAGSSVVLKVQKADGKVKDYKLVRRAFSTVQPETLTWANPDTAVVRIPTFDLGYNRKKVEELMTEAAKAKQLILDLRSNGGGAVINLTHLMGTLLPPGTPIGTFVGRQMVDRYVKETGGKSSDLLEIAKWTKDKIRAGRTPVDPFKGTIAVLINGGSGSAAEIAAAALQDQLGSPVIGSKSAGAVLVSVMVPLPHGYQLQYPINDFVTVSGYRIEGAGVKPDLEAPLTTKFGEADAGIERAIAMLQRMSAMRGGGK